MPSAVPTTESPALPDPIRRIPARAWLAAAATAVLMAAAWRAPIAWMVDRWTADESYYSHGFLVGPVVLWLAWNDRRWLLAQRAESSWLGLALLLAGLAALLLSGLLAVYFTAMFGFIMALWGLCGFLFGRAVLRRLLFPAFILTFMVPLPLATIAGVSLKLKLLATWLAVHLLGACGVLAINDGSTILLESGASVVVGNACSGLRSLISLVFLGILFAWISPLTPARKVLLFLSAIPIALLANVARVFGLCLVANSFGSDAISGLAHDASGYMIFVVAFLLLYAAFRLLGWRRPTARGAALGGLACAGAPAEDKEDGHA
ncbi:MAG: exosortase/archaeosortase family protein [bacterium]|nr:exosortase/archaeosortase family protein [bacterium]